MSITRPSFRTGSLSHRTPTTTALALLASISLAYPTSAHRQNSQPETAPPPARQPREKPKSTPPPPPSEPEAPSQAPAQPSKSSTPPSSQPAPAASPAAKPVAPARKPPTEPGPYLERIGQPRDYTLTMNVDVRPDSAENRDGNGMPIIGQFKFDTLAMVFPIPRDTANAKINERSILGTLKIDDRAVTETKPVLLEKQLSGALYHSGTRLLRFNTESPATCRRITLDFSIQMNLWQTKFKEAEAMKVDWPSGPWPAEAQATLEPQMFIDYERSRELNGPLQAFYDKELLTALVNEWSSGDPKKAKPAALAKFFAGKMISEFQSSGQGLQFLSLGQLQGFTLLGVPETIKRRRGSDFDIASVLVAAYRAAGLPARIVIGIEDGLTGAQKNIYGNRTNQELRCWVEFCLYDEPKNTVNWIPVDISKLRQTSSRPGPFDRAWAYFGSHEDMDHTAPIAFGFHPPTTVESYGAPGLWGWLMTPQPPSLAYQALRFRIDATTKRGADKKDSNENERKKQNK